MSLFERLPLSFRFSGASGLATKDAPANPITSSPAKHTYTYDDAKRVQGYLDGAGMDYLNAINGNTPESLIGTVKKLASLKRHLGNPKSVISIGVGQGEEIHALHELYKIANPRIIGVDISCLALNAAQQRASDNKISSEFVVSNATNLPFNDGSVSGIVLSSVLHEVYSYLPNGKKAWNEAIQEATRVLAEEGCLLIKDPAATDLKGNVRMTFISDLARQFYDYFRAEYCVFNSWQPNERERIARRRESNGNDFPSVDDNQTIDVSIDQAAEIMFVMRNFWNDSGNGLTHIGDKSWKEINETYYLPSNCGETGVYMSTSQYVEEVLRQGNLSLGQTPYKLVCVEQNQSQRPNTVNFLSSHFFLSLSRRRTSSEERSRRLISQTTNKMQLVFQKQRR